jgi:hypothetical protein
MSAGPKMKSMKKLLEPSYIRAFRDRRTGLDQVPRPGALVTAGYVEVLIDGEKEGLLEAPALGSGLAEIESRLLQQLATGGEPSQGACVAAPRIPQRDIRGNRVPWDKSPLAKWTRVVVVSAAGTMMALVSRPAPSGA